MLDNQGIDSLIGRTFNGYRVTRFIARGGMGVVFEARQESLDRPVAIKFLYPHLSGDPSFRERFEREARAVARLNHPNIVRVLDYGADGQLFYMVMDLVEGESLRERLARVHAEGLTLKTDTIISIAQQVGSALSHAHRLGYIHRDVKPGNILLARDGRAFLTDFGVVKILGDNQVTAAGVIIGTPEYMAPEQSSGESAIGPAADLYSLAVVTYEMMVGRVPFQAPTPVAVMRMHATEAPPLPSSLIPWFHPQIEAVLMRALAKDPADRYPSVDAFLGSLLLAANASYQFASGAFPIPGGTPYPTPGTPLPMAGPSLPPAATPASGASAPHPSTPSGTPVTPSRLGSAGGSGGEPPIPRTGEAATPPPPHGLPIGAAEGRPRRRRTRVVGGGVALALVAIALVAAMVSAGGYANLPLVGHRGSGAVPTATPTYGPQGSGLGGAVAGSPTATPGKAPGGVPAGMTPVILFSSIRGGVHESQIFIMNLDGSDQRLLIPAKGHSWGPRVSDDGTKLMFSSVIAHHSTHDPSGGVLTGEANNHDVYVADIGGPNSDGVVAKNVTNITTAYPSWDNGWSWSPDGKWIAFSSNRDGNYEIYKMTPDGKQVVRLTNDPYTNDGWPYWTPDGQRIVFAKEQGQTAELYLMDADGENVRQLTHMSGAFNVFPAVSPDGSRIVFSSQIPGINQGDIYAINMDGTGLTRLTNSAALNNTPSFCPDGQKIVYMSDKDGNPNFNVYIMNADGTGQTRLTSTMPSQQSPTAGDQTPDCAYVQAKAP